jgi:hypothetical protein
LLEFDDETLDWTWDSTSKDAGTSGLSLRAEVIDGRYT